MYSKTKFFLGANSNIDFISYFKQLHEQNSSMQLLILKGGPGSGKSSLMKKVGEYAAKKGHKLEIIPCASDPSSLDALIDYTANFAIMDGTAPHTEDPSLPGARDHIVYTGDLWDTKKLYDNADKIRVLSDTISECHKGAGAYIKAASALLSENMRYGAKFLRKDALYPVTSEMTKKALSGNKGKETKRLLSAVTVGEIKVFSETPYSLADRVYIINDKWGAAADFILKGIYNAASLAGEPLIYCPCSLMPEKCDHLIFPKSRIAILTENRFLKFNSGEVLNADNFYNTMPLHYEMEERLDKAQKLLPSACNLVKKAKDLHDDLEAFYVEAMDFSKMDGVFDDIIKRFYK